MISHNNMIPSGHFHKKWKDRVKTWFNQPLKKKRRAIKRSVKVAHNLPKPADFLRPMVHCPTVRYNSKVRAGRAFSLQELKEAGLSKAYAQTIGIAVDVRRTNKSIESILLNVQRLREYLSKVIIYPLGKKQKKAFKEPAAVAVKNINQPIQVKAKVKAKVLSEDEKNFSAYRHLRKVRADAKYAGMRQKRKRMKQEHLDQPFRKTRQLQDQQD